MSKREMQFKETILGKSLKWTALTIFIFFISLTIVAYNLMTVINENNIKKAGIKVITNLLDEGRDAITENYDALTESAKSNPEEIINISTGIQDTNIRIKGEDFLNLNADEFFEVIPERTVDQVYDETVRKFLSSEVDNLELPTVIKNQLDVEKSDSLATLMFYGSLLASLIFALAYYFLNHPKRFLTNIGIVLSLTAFPTYFILYMALPFLNSALRKSEISASAPFIMELSKQVQTNYLYILIFGIILILLGIAVQSDIKEFLRKKDRYERVIKTK